MATSPSDENHPTTPMSTPSTRVTEASPEAEPHAHQQASSTPHSSVSTHNTSSEDSIDEATQKSKKRLSRPPLGSRKSSGTMVIDRDSATVEVREEVYGADDARSMSPRRSSAEIDKMGQAARKALEDQANALQSNLLEIIERVDSVKSEHEKLEGGNKFLQSYIGELMSTPKLASSGSKSSKTKKGKGGK